MFKIKQIIKMLFQHLIFPIVYRVNCFRKVDDKLVILADAHHDACPPHLYVIKRELDKTDYNIVEMYMDISKHGFIKSINFMLDFMKIYPTARAVIICDNFLPASSCKKRNTTKLIQLWHGCGAFKKFGYDAVDDIPKGYIGNVYKNYDLVTVSGLACIKPFESAMGINKPGVVRAVGVSSTDQLFDEEYLRYCKDRFRYEHPDAVGHKVVLWAPSFRGNAGVQSGTEIIPGEDKIDAIDKEKFYVIKSFHPHMKRKTQGNMTTRELLVSADILITDYSSVFFEGLILHKDICFFATDYEEYTKERGYYVNYKELPGLIVTDDKDLTTILENGNFEEIRYNTKQFFDDFMSMCDGKSTERVLNYVKNGY